ncbi:hypothetical protein ACJIZ3_012314 [Penstemon smallii]|uniref:Uncharacterized protein n=1 Tax=Penstemon smallii TaxID=265156 RepID=A0ABD3UQ94_9LAMI
MARTIFNLMLVCSIRIPNKTISQAPRLNFKTLTVSQHATTILLNLSKETFFLIMIHIRILYATFYIVRQINTKVYGNRRWNQ